MCFQTQTPSLRPPRWTTHAFTCKKNVILHSVLLCTQTEWLHQHYCIACILILIFIDNYCILLSVRLGQNFCITEFFPSICNFHYSVLYFSSGSTDFLIYLLLPLPSQTDHLSPVAIESPRRKRAPDSFLHVLNTLTFTRSNQCQHLPQSQCFFSFWRSHLCEFDAVASHINELIPRLYSKKKSKQA